MKAGVSTASLFLRKNNEDALPVLNDLGVNVAEVFLTSFSEYSEAFATLLAERKGDLAVNSVHVLNNQIEPQLFSAHGRVLKDSFDLLDKVLAAARVLGAPYYTFHGLARNKKAARNPNNDNFERLGNALRKIDEFCKDRGVVMCLENVEWSTYNRVGVFTEMKKRVPDLKGVLDVKQARISGQPYELYLDEMGENIAYAHISDVQANGKMCLPGQGVFDFETFVKRLQDVGFDGALLIEAYKDDYREIAELKASCEYVREILYKLGALS